MYQSSYLTGYGTGRTGETISVWTGTDPAGKAPLILCHGFLGTSLQWYDTATNPIVVAAGAARSGVPAFGPDLGLGDDGLNNWGHDDTVDPGGAIDDAIEWAADTYGTRTDKVGIYGTSMGGTALAWGWRNPDRLAAAAFTIPCLATAALHTQSPLGLGAFMELAFATEGGFEASLPTHDPSHPDNVDQIIPIAHKIRAWYSSDDNVISAADVVAFGAATGVEVTNVGAYGHSLTWDQQQVLDWLIPRLWWA